VMRSQFVTASDTSPPCGRKVRPHTNEHPLPALCLHRKRRDYGGQCLNSPEAVRMSVFVVRAFVKMRDCSSTKELARQLAALEKKLTARLDGHEVAIVEVLRRVMDILDPPPLPEPPRWQIGFHVHRKINPKPSEIKRRELWRLSFSRLNSIKRSSGVWLSWESTGVVAFQFTQPAKNTLH